jgi:acyl CoA:acetate/3-ketoacid CoA transferase
VVIAQVAPAEGRTLPAQNVRVPGIVVDASSWPPISSDDPDRPVARSGRPLSGPDLELELAPWGPEKAVARRASRLRDEEAVNLGFGISALVPRILLEEARWIGHVGHRAGRGRGVPFLGFSSGARRTGRALASPDQFTYLQGGGFDRALLSFLEVDADGNVNVSRLNISRMSRPGSAASSISRPARRIVFSGFFTAGAQLAMRRTHRSSVKAAPAVRPEVQRHIQRPPARELGQEVVFVTERCDGSYPRA